MSWQKCPDPDLRVIDEAPVETVILPRARDLGEFEVRRALPSKERQMIGPFIFFDQMGPAEFLTDQGIDVRPHPHINLATWLASLTTRLAIAAGANDKAGQKKKRPFKHTISD